MVASQRVLIAVLGMALMASGCSSGPRAAGERISNAQEFVNEADRLFAEVVDGTPDELRSVSEDARCYFEARDEDEIGPVVFCGPIRVFGYEEPWLTMGYEQYSVEKGTVLSDPLVGDYATPQGRLFRPDGREPGDPNALATPLGPQTTSEEFAVLLPLDSVSGIQYNPIDHAATLKAPAATISVTETADITHVPAAAVTALDPEAAAGDIQEFRPADGQVLKAWKVKVSPAGEFGPELDEMDWGSTSRDATLSLALKVGASRLVLRSADTLLGAGSADGVAQVQCESVPCRAVESASYLLVVSTSAEGAPSLVGTTDGGEEVVSLDDGSLESSHSTAHYGDIPSKAQVSTSWGTKTFEAVSPEEMPDAFESEAIMMTYGADVATAYRTPFEVNRGWAPSGKTWLVLSVANTKSEIDRILDDVTVDHASSWTVKAAEEVLKAEEQDREDRIVFLVPDGVASFTVSLKPVASVSYKYTTKDFTSISKTKAVNAPEAMTVDITFS